MLHAFGNVDLCFVRRAFSADLITREIYRLVIAIETAVNIINLTDGNLITGNHHSVATSTIDRFTWSSSMLLFVSMTMCSMSTASET